MKVALVIEKFSPAGGAERACGYLARGLVARGHEVHVFARRIEPAAGVAGHLLDADSHATFAAQAERALSGETFDIVQSFTRTPRQDVLRLGGGIHREYLERTDVAYSALGRWWRRIRPKERAELRLEAESLKPGSFRRIIAVSRRVLDETVRHYRVPAEQIDVVYNGVDATEFKPSAEARRLIRNQIGAEESDYVLLFCGSGFRRKGLEYAIQAVDQVPRAKLVVVGEGSASSHPRVLRLGRRTDVSHLYAAADALLLPTLYDPFPNVTLEAMASGIPIIVSRVAGVSEILEGDSIVVDDPTDVRALSEAVRRLEDPQLRIPMGEAARRKALQYPIERVVDQTLQVYDRVLRPRPV